MDAGSPAAAPSALAEAATSRQSAPPLLWDGASGVSKDYFNFGARIPWENIGGDWAMRRRSSGFVRLCNVTFAGTGPATTTITPLVQRWYANGNTGAYLKCMASGPMSRPQQQRRFVAGHW
jgi:hypothetical protein